MLLSQEVCRKRTIRQEKPKCNSPDGSDTPDDHELVPPSSHRTIDLSDAVQNQRADQRADTDRRVPDCVSERLLLALVPHGSDEGEGGRDAGFGEAQEKSLDHETSVAVYCYGGDRDTSPDEHRDGDVFAEGEALGEIYTW